MVETLVENSLTLEFASKNTEVKKEGTHVSASEMLHLSLTDNSQSDFVGKTFPYPNIFQELEFFLLQNHELNK